MPANDTNGLLFVKFVSEMIFIIRACLPVGREPSRHHEFLRKG